TGRPSSREGEENPPVFAKGVKFGTGVGETWHVCRFVAPGVGTACGPMATIVEPVVPNAAGPPSGSLSPPSHASMLITIGRFDCLSTVKLSVASRPVPPAPGGELPLVTQPTRTVIVSTSGSRQVTGRPVLPRNGPFTKPSNCRTPGSKLPSMSAA